MQLSLIDSVNICDQQGEIATLKCNLTGGLDPISINWSSGEGLDSINVNPSNTTTYSITAFDNCNKEIFDSCKVWVQCPIENINIFTPNNDGLNDFFIPINLEQYPYPTLIIYNRWGEIVYENENYQNDWEGTHYLSCLLYTSPSPRDRQ